MGFKVTPRGQVKRTSATTGALSDTFTPSENDIVIFQLAASSATALTTVTGWSATWFNVLNFPSTDHFIHFYAARIGSSPGSDQIDVTHGTLTYSSIAYQIEGANTTADVSGGPGKLFPQAVGVSTFDPSSPLALPSMGAYADPKNLSLTLGSIVTNSNEFSAQSGWTRANPSDTGDTSNDYNTSLFYKEAEDTTHTVEGTDFTDNYVSGIGLEMARAPSNILPFITKYRGNN